MKINKTALRCIGILFEGKKVEKIRTGNEET